MFDNILLLFEKGAFGEEFNLVRFKRVNQLLKCMGKDWFKGKKVLEMGCAFGNIGFYLESLGAKVHFSDARIECLKEVKKKNSNSHTILLDNEEDWSLDEYYDLIIHWGLLYNLNYWERDLRKTLSSCNYMALETAVTKYDNNYEYKIVGMHYTHEWHGPSRRIGTLTSSKNIENVLIKKDCKYKRYDEDDLNAPGFLYNWKEEPASNEVTKFGIVNNWWDNPHNETKRRFWMIRSNF